MRQGTFWPSLMVAVLTIGIVSYFWFSFWESMTNPFSTTIAYSYTVSKGVDAKGVLIREEYLLPPVSGLLDVLRSEGEQVGVGQVVGRVYRDVSAMEEQNQHETRLAEAQVLEYALGEKKDIITVTKMDEEIVTAMSSLRSSVVTGNYNKLENQIVELKGNILRRDYIFGSATVAMAMDDRYAQLTYNIANNTQMIGSAVTNVTTPVSGAYSILVDGLESLTMDEAKNLTLSELDELLEYTSYHIEQGAGKIITGDTWYFVTAVESEWVEKLYEGGRITVRFSGDFSQDITMTVEQIGSEVEGQRILILSSTRYLEQTTLLRIQTVELVYESYSGLRVPKEAMRMVAYTNQETGEVREVYGVYVMSAGYAEFKPAHIVAEGIDYFLVNPTSTGAGALREGNEVVVNAVGLYDGKLLEY